MQYGGTDYSRKITEEHANQFRRAEDQVKRDNKEKMGEKAQKVAYDYIKARNTSSKVFFSKTGFKK